MKVSHELLLTVEYDGYPDSEVFEDVLDKLREHGRVILARVRFTPALEQMDLLAKGGD